MMECKAALEEAGGDFEKAIVVLRKKGMAAAGKKADRIAAKESSTPIFIQAARSECWSN